MSRRHRDVMKKLIWCEDSEHALAVTIEEQSGKIVSPSPLRCTKCGREFKRGHCKVTESTDGAYIINIYENHD